MEGYGRNGEGQRARPLVKDESWANNVIGKYVWRDCLPTFDASNRQPLGFFKSLSVSVSLCFSVSLVSLCLSVSLSLSLSPAPSVSVLPSSIYVSRSVSYSMFLPTQHFLIDRKLGEVRLIGLKICHGEISCN